MAIFQALVTWLGRSASRILNAIFGWAVLALFGKQAPRQQTLLSGVVAMAAAWPVLVLGIALPRLATFLLAFVPLSRRVPSWILRVVWIALAVAVPLVVGAVVARKGPDEIKQEPWIKRLLRGFPITVGIAAAFLLAFLTAPVLRVVTAARRRRDEHVPCITEGADYHVVASQIDRALAAYDLGAQRAEPPWWLTAPSKIMGKLAGRATQGLVPQRLAYWRGPALEVAYYPSDVLVRGEKDRAAWTHGVLAEQLARGPGLQTLDPKAQELERRIHARWPQVVAAAGPGGPLAPLASELGGLPIDYDNWQVLYRQLTQLGRALRGEPQLLEHGSVKEEAMASKVDDGGSIRPPLDASSTTELLSQLVDRSTALVKKEIELAKVELRADAKREVKMIEGLSAAAVCALFGVNLLLVAVVFALAQVLPGWVAALIVASPFIVAAVIVGVVSWNKRVQTPLEKTRKTLEEDARWARQRIA